MGLYGGAGFLSIVAMLAVGGMRLATGGHDSTLTGGLAGIAFIFPICFMLASLMAGTILGLSIEIQACDD